MPTNPAVTARDEAVADVIARAIGDPGAVLARGDNYRESIPRWGTRAVIAELTTRPDVLRVLAESAGLLVLDSRSNVDIQRLGYALAVEGARGHTSYYVTRAIRHRGCTDGAL